VSFEAGKVVLGRQMRLTERLPRTFNSDNKEQAQEYLTGLRDAWRDISTALTRNAWIIVLLIAAFELAIHGAVSTVTVGPFALANLKYVTLFIPSVISYLFYEQTLLVARWIETEEVHRYLTHMLSPAIEEYDFDALLSPRLPALSNLVHSYSSISATASKHLKATAQYVLGALVLIAIPVFDGFALKELSDEFGLGNVMFWINLTVTAILVLLTLIVSVLWLAEERLVV
jgi:hypothetical protein